MARLLGLFCGYSISIDLVSTHKPEEPDTDIVAKIDCEGSEYEILDSLAATGQLGQMKIIMMEWHKKGPDALVKHLQDFGFIIFSRMPRSKNVGTLYAIKP